MHDVHVHEVHVPVTSARRRFVLGARHALTWNTGRVLAWLRWLVTSYLALAITFWILPGDQTSNPAALVVVVLVVGALNLLLRPVLLTLVVVVGSLGLLLIGVVTQAVVLDVALSLTPGAYANPFLDVLAASWIAAAVIAAVNWVFDAGSEDAYLAQVLGRAVRVAHRYPVDGPGLLIIQLDGVAAPVLRQAITAGAVPTLSRWLSTGTHTLRDWHTGLPSTTPGGQAVLLHGDDTTVPSFRWYEKGDPGRLMVANRPRDATDIEARMSDGRGLLADGGVSVSNLFSGDAPTRVLTMSDARLPSRRTPGFAAFATGGGGFVRSLVLFVGEIVSELQQARRQKRRGVWPRVSRRGAFVVLRAVTTVLLRDINVAVVAEQMARGAPVIYVDFVDYDEVAHHAGPTRPESMRTLDGLDRVLASLARVAQEVGRDYEIVVLSDHGQAQGATFSQRTGEPLHAVVARLAGAANPTGHEDVDTSPAEQWGPANALLTGAARRNQVTAGATRNLLGHRADQAGDNLEVTLGRGRRGEFGTPPTAPVVAASGSLAHLYLIDLPGRAPLEQVDATFPGLAEGLAGHPWIGLVLVRSADGLLTMGADGARLVVDDVTAGGWGVDPVAPYGPGAAAALAQLDRRDHVGDLVLLGRLDPEHGDVTAFEELVGSHGGLGGGQTQAVLIHPTSWGRATEALDGRAVHRLLLGRLEHLGLRQPAPNRAAAPGPATTPERAVGATAPSSTGELPVRP